MKISNFFCFKPAEKLQGPTRKQVVASAKELKFLSKLSGIGNTAESIRKFPTTANEWKIACEQSRIERYASKLIKTAKRGNILKTWDYYDKVVKHSKKLACALNSCSSEKFINDTNKHHNDIWNALKNDNKKTPK